MLRSQPTLKQVQEKLQDWTQSPQDFDDLLTVTIYDYPDLDYSQVCSSVVGVGCLVSEISLVANKTERLDPLLRLLDSILRTKSLLSNIYSDGNSTQLASLFCGSRLLSVTSSLGRSEWFCKGDCFSEWLAEQLVQFPSIPPKLLDRTFKLGFPQKVLKVLLKDFAKFQKAFSMLGRAQKTFILGSMLRYLDSFPSANPSAIAAIWEALQPRIGIDDLRMGVAYNDVPFSAAVQRASVIGWTQGLETATLELVKLWGSKLAVSQVSILIQHAQTQVLLGCASQLDKESLDRITSTPQFSTAISTHLAALSEQTRLMGTIVAEVFVRQSGQKLSFGMEYSYDYFFAKEQPMELTKALSSIESESTVVNALPQVLLPPDATPVPDVNDPIDSDDEDEETCDAPVYIRDLLDYLRSDDYAKQRAALVGGPDLLHRKAHFKEVQQYSRDLLIAVAQLTDKFNINNFSELRQTLLIAIVVGDPPMAVEVCKLLVNGDYSLYQRLSLMNSLVGAAQELSNFHSVDFASEKLPGLMHRAFYSPVDSITSSLQDKLVIEARNEQQAKLGPSMLLQNTPNTKSKPPATASTGKNLYSKIAGKYFFFPLCACSPQAQGLYSELLTCSWLKTLGLLVYMSYPTNDMGDFVTEMLRIIDANVRQTEPTILEALFTDILLLCDVAPLLLVQQHFPKIGELYEWVESIWRKIPDEKTQKVAAASILRLGEILENAQNRFLQQYS